MTTVKPIEESVKISPAQRTRGWKLARVLRAIRAGEIWQEPDGRSVETFAEFFGVSDPIGEVTEEVRLAEVAGLARTKPLRHGPGARWELTAEGAQVLADLDVATAGKD